MPFEYVRRLTGRSRSAESNLHLGFVLAFVAGATNAGGFLAVQQYTSHMTGIVSAMADNLALSHLGLVLDGLGALLSFLFGAAASAVMINYARRERMHSEYALPLLLEAALLLCFGLLGGQMAKIEGLFVPLTVMLLCFIMGLQNSLVTKLSGAEIRATHLTGMITDIGIELGKLFYWNRLHLKQPDVLANRRHLRILVFQVSCFFGGGLIGALGFKHLGYFSTVWLAMLLIVLAALPVVDDLRVFGRRFRRKEF